LSGAYVPALDQLEDPLVRPQRSDEIGKKIVDLIVERRLPPGAPIPTEVSLMQDLDVSRNSIREAIKALEALGIVEIRHGFGTFVGSAGAESLRTWLLFRTRTRGVTDVGRLRDVLEVREIIETELTCRVAGDHRLELIAALKACVKRMETDGPDGDAADREFHDLICAEAGFDLAREFITLFWDVYRETEREVGQPLTTPRHTAKRHQRIIDALTSGEPGLAAEAVHRHFDEVRQRVNAGSYGGFGEARPTVAVR